MDGKELKVHDKIQRYIRYKFISSYINLLFRMTLDVFGKSIFDMEFKVIAIEYKI
jgi:hypothetical protein